MDRKGVTLTQQEYERLRRDAGSYDIPGTLTLGRRFEDAINQKLNDEIIGNFVANLFKVGPVADVKKPHTGIIGTFLDIADTKMGYAFGQTIAEKSTDLVKMIGADRIGAMIDAASGVTPNQQQAAQQLSPEEQQKRIETKIMSFDSTNISDMNEFMQATGIKNLAEAQRILLENQEKIIQSRGLSKPPQQVQAQVQSPNSPEIQSPRNERNRKSDINRDLMDKYDNPDQYQASGVNVPRQNDFFNSNLTPTNLTPIHDIPPIGADFQQTPEEIILSLNPDDPSSIHQYASMRNIVNLDVPTIKKMLMQEQRNLLSKSPSPVLEINQPITDITPSSIPDTDKNQNRGISPDEDQSRLKGGDLLKQKLEIQKQEQQNQSKSQEVQDSNPQSQVIESESESSMDVIMRVLNKLDKKIDYLESEITVLKKSNEIKADDLTDIISSEEQTKVDTTKYVDVETLSSSSGIVGINEVTKDIKTEVINNDTSGSHIYDNKDEHEDTKKEEEHVNITSESNDENSSQQEIASDSKKGDWWKERGKLMDEKSFKVKKFKLGKE